MGVAKTQLPVHRRIETILVLTMVLGAATGAAVGLFSAVWTLVVTRSFAESGEFIMIEMVLGAGIGFAVGVPTGVVWAVAARPGQDALIGARWAAALTAALAVVALSLALLEAVSGYAFLCAAAAAAVIFCCGPRLGVWRSAP